MAVSKLNRSEFMGCKLNVELHMDEQEEEYNIRGPRSSYAGPLGSGRQTGFPLRILVPSNMVGAIIGKKGSTIGYIARRTRSRIEVVNITASLEKQVTIYGNSSDACKSILRVMHPPGTNTYEGEITLKIISYNLTIGRLVGKNGTNIRKIMRDTNSKIRISRSDDMNSPYLERIITVKGSLENVSRAEAFISANLRSSYKDYHRTMPKPQRHIGGIVQQPRTLQPQAPRVPRVGARRGCI